MVTRPSSLLRILGLSFGLAVTVGNSIGAGILRTPGDVASLLPSAWMFVGVWVVGGLYALLGANALAEIGTMIPRSGGQYVFARRAFGDYAGFVVGWMDWISTCAAAAAIAFVIGESIVAVAQLPAHLTPLVATVASVFFVALLTRGTKIGDRAQQITSLIKTVALLALVAACFAFAGRIHAVTQVAAPAIHAAPTVTFAAVLLAAQSVIYTYDGWSGPIYFSEELEDPGRQIPLSMFLGLLCVATIYLLINIAFVYALPTSALAGSPLAAATVAKAIFGSRGELLVRAVVIVSIPSALVACLLMASRTLFALGRDGLGVPGTTRVNRGGTPVVSLVASGAVVVAFLLSGTFQTTIAIAAFYFVADYTLSFLAVFVMRRQAPAAARPFSAVGHPWTTGFVVVGSVAFLVSAVVADRRNSFAALGILIVSYPVFRVSRQQPGAMSPATGPSVPAASADPYVSGE